ncbi:HNH endonuclease [Azotobacter vinelandii]|nr:HNH endonuclease [Azotobacter vinelandii]
MKRVADEVDHITPLSQGGTDDDSNLRAIASRPCHARKTAREAAMRR